MQRARQMHLEKLVSQRYHLEEITKDHFRISEIKAQEVNEKDIRPRQRSELALNCFQLSMNVFVQRNLFHDDK